MENNKKLNLAKGILAAGTTITATALHELLLSKKEHDKKERQITKIEKEKDKYMKKIGAYEPFDVEKGTVVPNDHKVGNLLTKAVGVMFSNDDVFTRNKSNIRTFPFIISNNSSINANVEVELRKYYEIMVASQMANLIDHTVFAAENILNIKDKDMKSADKILRKVFNNKRDMTDVGTSLQRGKGIYENVLYDKGNEVGSLNEDYTVAYSTLNSYINDYKRIIKSHVSNIGEKNRLIKKMREIELERDAIVTLRRSCSNLDYSLAPGAVLTSAEKKIEQDIKDLFDGRLKRSFDGLEDEDTLIKITDLRNEFVKLVDYPNKPGKFDNTKGRIVVERLNKYIDVLGDYHRLLSDGINIISNNNFTDPKKELSDADPYYKLLDLPRVDNYNGSSEIMMKMFNNSPTLKVKLEMAAALLISTEILPFEFIEYVTKFLNVPMFDKTKMAIGMEYGTGTEKNPLRFMGNFYVVSGKNSKDGVLSFAKAMRPQDYLDSKKLAKKLSMKQLKANNFAFGLFDLFKNREQLETKWAKKHGDKIDKRLASVYTAGDKLDDKKRLRNIDKQVMNQNKKMINRADEVAQKLSTRINSSQNNDTMFSKSLSLLGAGGNRVHKIIEDRLKNKIVDLRSVEDMDKSLEYFMSPSKSKAQNGYDPTAAFRPNLTQAQKLMQSIWSEGIEDRTDVTILTEQLITDMTNEVFNESMVYNLYKPERTVTYKEVNKDPIEYILPAYTKGRSLLYGSTEIDADQFKTRKVGEPIWIKVTFSDKINSVKSDMTDNDFTTVIGIKSEVHRVPEKEIEKVLRKPTGNVPALSSVFRSQKGQTLGLLSKIANENDLKSASLNGVLVVSLNEATSNISSKPSDDYINNPKLGVSLRKTYNLTSMCLVDPIAEEYFIMEEHSSSWSRLPFAELRSSGGSSDIKSLASLLGSTGRR